MWSCRRQRRQRASAQVVSGAPGGRPACAHSDGRFALRGATRCTPCGGGSCDRRHGAQSPTPSRWPPTLERRARSSVLRECQLAGSATRSRRRPRDPRASSIFSARPTPHATCARCCSPLGTCSRAAPVSASSSAARSPRARGPRAECICTTGARSASWSRFARSPGAAAAPPLRPRPVLQTSGRRCWCRAASSTPRACSCARSCARHGRRVRCSRGMQCMRSLATCPAPRGASRSCSSAWARAACRWRRRESPRASTALLQWAHPLACGQRAPSCARQPTPGRAGTTCFTCLGWFSGHWAGLSARGNPPRAVRAAARRAQ